MIVSKNVLRNPRFLSYIGPRCMHGGSKNKETSGEIQVPPEPTNCCMSGCANCVWIQYAEELQKLFQDGGEKARKMVIDKVQDPNMRAFLDLELRTLKN